jgi:hypothetical protein
MHKVTVFCKRPLFAGNRLLLIMGLPNYPEFDYYESWLKINVPDGLWHEAKQSTLTETGICFVRESDAVVFKLTFSDHVISNK